MPTMEEESFPRGGTVSAGKKRKHKNQEQELFRSNQDDEGSKSKKRKDRHVTLEKRVAIKKRKDKQEDQTIRKNLAAITPLTAASCPVNMLVLGCVKEVHDYHIDVSLPNGLTGRVPITAISDGYTDMLQKLAKGDFSIAKDIKNLTELFRPGMVVRCKITEVPKKESKKHKMSLSLNPRDLNSALASTGLKNGMVLCGCISSIEEHGYVVDLGVTGIVAFLKNKEAQDYIEDYNDGKSLHVGSYVHCMVNAEDKVEVIMGESRTIHVTINPRQTFRAEVTRGMGIKMNTLIPGMRVTAKVQKILDKGVKVHFLGYAGTIHRTHLMQHSMKLEQDQELTAAVLYVHPVTKVVSLTCQTHLVTPDLAPRRLFGDYHYGQVVEEAKVLKVDAKSGVYLKLDDRVVGFAKSGNLGDGDIKDVSRQFPKGSTVRCRVMNFDFSDNVVLVTLKKSILDRQFLRYEDLKVAEDVEVEVKEVTKGGVSVTISNHIKGFIPNSHLADVPLKHPERRFTPGAKITARVLTVNTETKKIILTTKKTILGSVLPRLTEYSQARPGMVLEGVVNKVTDRGLKVLFYNGVKGFVPQGLLSTEFVEDLSKVFYIGQVVKVQIVKSVPEEERLILSLQIRDKSGKKKSESKTPVPSDIEVGKVVSVVVRGKVEKGLFVDLVDSEVQAFLPREHLSDHLLHCDLLHAVYTKGDRIEDCAVLSIDKRIIVTKKQTFVSAAKDEMLIKKFEDVKLGLEMPGSIRNKMDYGLFVDLSASLIGLAPVKFLLDERVPEPTKLYQLGQSVIAKVTEVNEEKQRLLVSLRLEDCYHGDIDEGISLLDDYLKESARVMELYRERGDKQTLASHSIGELVKVTITKVTKQGVLCSLPDGTKALATDDHVREVTCKPGKEYEAVVLYVDLVANCLEVSLNTRLVEQVKHYVDTKYTTARREQTLKSEVLLIKDDFVLIALKGHAQGQLAYLPAKTHLNDVLEKRQYQITQQNAVVIKGSGPNVLACLEMHDNGKKSDKKNKVLTHHFLPGVITSAKIKQVLDFQLNIVMGGIHGRVHISQVADKVKVGSNPLKKFKADQEVQVKVIGYRELKTSKHLPVTHSKVWTALPECTLRPSSLKSAGLLQSENVHKSTFERGDQVTVYVQKFVKNCLWVHVSPKFHGKIRRCNVSEDEQVQADPLSHFKAGTAHRAMVVGPGKANVLELSFIGIPEEISAGENVEGTVTKVGENGVFVKLDHGYLGRVGLTDITDRYVDRPWEQYKEGQTVTVHLLNAKDREKCVLSLRQSRVSGDAEDIHDPELSPDDVKEGEMVRGYISNNANRKKVFVTLSHGVGAKIDAEKLTEPKLKRPASVFFVGKVVHGKIIKAKLDGDVEKKVVEMSLLEADTGVPSIAGDEEDVPTAPKRKASEDEPTSPTQKKSKKAKAEKPKKQEVKDATEDADGDSDSGVEEDEEDIRLLSPKAKLTTTAPRLALSAGFTWDNTFTLPAPEAKQPESDSDSDEEEGPKKKKKARLTRQEKLAAQRDEERRLLETERRLVGTDQQPTSAEDFDRLVLQSPDSSLVWLGYMAHHLETTEIEKARAVAERALKTISFREEQEKMNVWVAFLNLENLYGTADTLKGVFERAVQHNEPLKVYTQLVGIYDKSDKAEAAEQLYSTMIRRFSPVKDVWINFGLFLFKHKKADDARKLMQRSLKSLDQKHHVEVISKFAQMEFKHGEAERGKTMFENVLSSYPRRTDLWSVYIDMVIKLDQLQQVRNIFERVIALNLAAKKMKFFFKKQLDFEQKHGTEETVAAVKQKALDYVEARASLT